MADEITFSSLSSAGGRVANVLSAMLFEKLHDPTDLRAVMTEVPWGQIGSDSMRVTVDGAPGAFAAASSETSGGGANAAYGSGKFDLQIARYIRRYQMSDLFGVSGGPIDVNKVVQTLADGVGLTMTDLLTTLFNSLSSSVDAGTSLTVDGFYNGVYTLNLAGAVSTAEAPYSLVLHPKQMNDLRASIRGESAGSPIQYTEGAANALMARRPFQGVNLWQSDSVTKVDTNTHYSAGMFAKDCFAYTMAPVLALTGHVPASNIIVDAGELLVENDRDGVNGLTTAIASMFVAVAETQDALGVEIKSDV